MHAYSPTQELFLKRLGAFRLGSWQLSRIPDFPEIVPD